MKKRGTITLLMILLCASFISFSIVIINFTRIHNANSRLQIVCDFVSDSILSKYDSYLYDEYRIMGVKEEENLQENLRDMAIRCLKYENSNFNFYGFKDVELEVKPLSDFSNIKSFKTAIINANRNKFLVESAQRAVNLVKFWKLFMDGKALADLHVEAMKVMGELQSRYDECVEISKKIQEIYEKLKDKGGDISSHEMILLAYQYRSIADSKSDEDMDRKREIREIFDSLESLEKNVRMLLKKLRELKQDCEHALSSFDEAMEKIAAKRENVEDEEFKSAADEMIKEIQKNKRGVFSAAENLSEILVNLENGHNRFLALEMDIKKAKSGEEIEHDDFNMKEVIEVCELHLDIFDSKEENKVDAMSVLKFMWKVLTGGLLPNYSRFDLEIKDDIYLNLPSVKTFGMQDIVIDNPSENRGSYGNMCKEGMEYYSKNGELKDDMYLYLSDGNAFEDIIDKLSIVDFALEYFDYNVHEREACKIGETSKNPLYQSEIEYLLHGNKSPKWNMIFTDMKIWAMRNAANAISLSIYKRSQIHSISAVLSCATLGVGYPVIYGVVTFSWSGLESLCDLRELHRDNAILIFKGKNSFFIDLSAENIERMVNEIENNGLEGMYTARKEAKTQKFKGLEKSQIHLDYRDYLFILLCFSDEIELLHRIQDVMQIRGFLKDENFDIQEYQVMYELNIRSKLPLIYSDLINANIISESVAGF